MTARILDQLDTPVERARLARTIIHLRDTKRLDSLHAAAAIIDLDSRSRTLLHASLVHAAFIHTGRLKHPAAYASPPEITRRERVNVRDA